MRDWWNIDEICVIADIYDIVSEHVNLKKRGGNFFGLCPFHNEIQERDFDIIFKSFDCAEMEKLDNNFSKLIEENGCPDVFINCAYPKTNDWDQCSFNKITLQRMIKNMFLVLH